LLKAAEMLGFTVCEGRGLTPNGMTLASNHREKASDSLENQVRRAVFWRTGSQILAQMVQWAATFLVIRILDPRDYGLYAMTGVVLVFLNMLNGYGLASGLIQRDDVTPRQTRQLFGMLIALNGVLAAAQLLIAPLAAAYYHQPEVARLSSA
jgi:O-antigen/teichoic acid export membrane protein